jgi:hypothetical protein
MQSGDRQEKQQRTARRHFGHRHRCTVCRHEDKWRIELLLASGASVESLARKFGLSGDAVSRHWRNHVSDQDKTGHLAGIANLDQLAAKAAETGSSVLDYLKIARNTLLTQLSVTQMAGDARVVGYLTGQLVRVLEVIGRLSGELVDVAAKHVTITNVNMIAQHPAFMQLQAITLKALQPHPEARAAVARAYLDEANAPRATPAAANGKLIEHEAAHVS